MSAVPSAPSPSPARPAPPPAVQASLSQAQLIRRRFSRHGVAVASLYILAALYFVALFSEFFAPYPATWKDLPHAYCPPQPPRFSFARGFYLYAVKQRTDPITYLKTYAEDPADIVPLGFCVKGEPYKLWNLIPWDRHFCGVDLGRYHPPEGQTAAPTFYLLGADQYGQDVFSRVILASRISLSVGLVGVFVALVLGVTIGGISGYLGGHLDNVIQRSMEVLNSLPSLPLWMALAAAMPRDWTPLQVYFAITVLLALLGWTGLARVVRGKFLSLREEDFVVAARLMGASHKRIIFIHLLPGFASHIIVSVTLAVPGMILGETALSFLGLGLKPPVVSWGVMIKDCMYMQTVANYPWLFMPVLFVIGAVLCFNYLGDGLRDAADPYAAR